MNYERVGFIIYDGPDGIRTHTEILICPECGALVTPDSLDRHASWHTETVTPS